MKPGDIVRPFFASDRGDNGGECLINGAYECPTFILQRPDGSEFAWAQHLCRPVDDREAIWWQERVYDLEQKLARTLEDKKKVDAILMDYNLGAP
jgi:hypothetical protein